MAYVLEEISDEDYEKYSSELEHGISSCWAIDRERDIWFRKNMDLIDRDENPGEYICTLWYLYWKKTLITWIETEFVKKKFTVESGEYYAHIELTDIKIPQEIEEDREEILREIKIGLGLLVIDISKSEKAKSFRVDLEYEGRFIC